MVALLVALFAGVVFLFRLLLKPKIIVSDSGLVVVNYLKTYSYRWPETADSKLATTTGGSSFVCATGRA